MIASISSNQAPYLLQRFLREVRCMRTEREQATFGLTSDSWHW